MAKSGQPVHGGSILINRWYWLGQAVAIVRRIFNAAKAGHCGTDPLASGVLPIALGEATKTVAYAMGDEILLLYRNLGREDDDR